MKWSRTPEGFLEVESSLGKEIFHLREASQEEAGKFGYTLDRLDAIYRVLSKAKGSFEQGLAEYFESERRLSDLMDSLSISMVDLKAAAYGVSEYFEPPESGAMFLRHCEGRLEDLIQFGRWWARVGYSIKVPDVKEEVA
jgi:hypothetical protein